MSEAMRLEFAEDLTIYGAVGIKERLLDAVRGAERLELDLSRVGAIDSAGVQLLMLAKRESLRLGHDLRIVGHSPAVHDVIDFTHMAGWFGDPLVIPAGGNPIQEHP